MLLNAKQIHSITTYLFNKSDNNPYRDAILELHEYSKYFPLAEIDNIELRNTKAINKYMNSSDTDLSPLSCLNLGNNQLMSYFINKF